MALVKPKITIYGDEVVGTEFRGFGNSQMNILMQQMAHQGLKQASRIVAANPYVYVECVVCFGLREINIFVAPEAVDVLLPKQCWCCGPCLIGGAIAALPNENYDSADFESDYYADVLICQKAGEDSHYSIYMADVKFSDYSQHAVGDSVLVLVMPIYDFIPDAAEPLQETPLAGCVNQGMYYHPDYSIAPKTTLAQEYPEPVSCGIMGHAHLWTDTEADTTLHRYFPLRILPFNIASCLTSI